MSQEDFQKELTSLRSEIINFQREPVKSRDNINKLRIGATNKLISKLFESISNALIKIFSASEYFFNILI